MALFRKFFYKKPPDGLLEITERVYGTLPVASFSVNSLVLVEVNSWFLLGANISSLCILPWWGVVIQGEQLGSSEWMFYLLEIHINCGRNGVFDYCFTTDVMEEEEYRVYIGGIIGQLRGHFPDASFMVFNMREGDSQSQISNILCDYDMTVIDYPRQYEGCPLLTMEMIHHFLRSGENWLLLGQQNVVLMHCERGGWPLLAFMLAALLIYRKMFTGEQKTLDMIYKQAPRELLQLMSPLNPLPSQLRYLQYISRRNVGSEWPPLDRALTLDCVIIRLIPNMGGEGGCRPIFRIYGQDPFIPADRTPKVLFSTPKRSKLVRYCKQVTDCELVKIDIHCHVQGDVVFECIHLHSDLEHEEMMFRVMFNTAFIRSNILMLNRDEIDILWNAKDYFPKNFRVEVLFSDMDTSSSVISLDLPRVEEKEGLPVEAFAKVKEIFSNVDWLDSKEEVASVLQQITASNILLERLDTGVSAATSDFLKESSEKFTAVSKPHSDTSNLTSAVQGKHSTSSLGSSVDVAMENKTEPLGSKTLSENDIETLECSGHRNQPIHSFGLSKDSDSTEKGTESLATKQSLENHTKINASMAHGIQSIPSIEPSVNANSMKKESGSLESKNNHPLELNVSPENSLKTSASTSQGKQLTPSFGLTTDSSSTERPVESFESKTSVENDAKVPTSMAHVEQSMSSIGPSKDANSMTQDVGPLESKSLTDGNLMEEKMGQLEQMVLSESDTKSVTSTVQGKQYSPLLELPVEANPIKAKIEPQELQVSLQLPTQSKIISSRVRPAVRSASASASYFNSLKGSPVAISRYHSAPSALGITSVLQDHAAVDIKEVTHAVTVSPPASALPPSGSKVLNFVDPSSTKKTFGSLPPAAVTTTPSPPPPPPPLPQCNHTSNLMPSNVTQYPENTNEGKKPLVSPPLPPPLAMLVPPIPSLSPAPSLPETSHSATKVSCKGPPAPPPPPALSGFPSSLSMNESIAMPGLPPPPPPPCLLGSTPPLAPPPPPPPASAFQNSLSKNSINGPPVPPPPPPSLPGSTPSPSPRAPPPPPPPGSASQNSLSSSTNVPPVPPPPISANGLSKPAVPGPPSAPFGAKERGLMRANPKGQSKRSNLKPYHWLKLTRAMQGSLWAETQKLDEFCRAPEFDMSELETLFSAAAPATTDGKGGKLNRRASGLRVEKVQLIELRRAYNCEIMLTKVKIPLPDLMCAVLAMDDSVLDVDQVENLIKFSPTKEEMETLKNYTGNKDNLGKCEQFFIELMKVPRVESKLRVFSFKMQFLSQVSELKRDLNIVNSASEEIRNSVKLKRIMQTILSLGNALNHGTARGSAVGFRLDSLLKLTDTRARNSKMTLMHYLCKGLYAIVHFALDNKNEKIGL
ncbi:hypothetical protein VNO80_02544 [Phaseolus coccineus]|uniref:Formin-like protein n=1 Tax=Phaseolus coccineus TaxID=3886 RepID=A0AAN9NV88_PHACN